MKECLYFSEASVIHRGTIAKKLERQMLKATHFRRIQSEKRTRRGYKKAGA